MSLSSDFFQVGGTLSIDAPSYIERPADAELLAALERHEFCLVLGPRQMGKSSLMVHAMSRLHKKGVATAVVDLQPLGSEANIERWFRNVVYQIKRTTRLKTDTKEWWNADRDIGPTQRFMAFLEDVLLTEISGDVVLFFDEIDSVLNLPFSDDFFTTIRSLYNARAVNTNLRRVSVVLLGVATPSAFIKDRTRTPFNIGESITLTDFSKDSAQSFQEVLGTGSEQLVDRIFHWTNGQPLLVQRLAAAAYSWPDAERTPERIDSEVHESYLQLKIEKDTHLKFIQDYLLDAKSGVRKTLSTYLEVLLGNDIENNEQSPVQDRLKLAGVVKVENGKLATRNRIYRSIFNLQWVQEHLPVNIQKWVAYGASIMLVLVLIAFFGLYSRLMAPLASDGSKLGRPLRVGIVTWPGYAGGLVANNGFKPNKDCIYWTKYGQTVEFLLLEDISVRNQLFSKGGEDGVDIVWSTVDFWANETPGFFQAGVRARAIMQVDWSRGGDALVADKSITKIEDLKGKKISLALFTPSHWLLESSLENSSLDEVEQSEIVKNLVGRNASPDALAEFLGNKVDAAVVWEPDVTEAVNKRPGAHIVVSTQTAQNLIADLMVAREDFITDHPDVIKAFIQGWFDGTTEANRNPDKAAKVLVDNEPVYGDLGEQVTKQGLATVKLADLADNTQMFGLDGSDPLFDRIFKQAGEAWMKRGYIHSILKPEYARDITFLKEVYALTPVSGSTFTQVKPVSPGGTDALPISTKRVNIIFATNSSAISRDSIKVIDDIAILAMIYSNSRILIETNTDSAGSSAHNIELSKQRAQAIVDYLVEHYSQLDRSRFEAKGNGASKPVMSNATAEGRAANRRTDIAIVPIK